MARDKPASKTVRIIYVYAAVVLLAGCALQEKGQWVKPGMTEAQRKQDNYECTRDATYYTDWGPHFPHHWHLGHGIHPWPRASVGPRLDWNLYEMCMDAKGYVWQPDKPE